MDNNEKIARFIERRADGMEKRKTATAPWVVLRAVASDVRAGLHDEPESKEGSDAP